MDGYLLEAKKEMSYCPTRLDEHRYEINLTLHICNKSVVILQKLVTCNLTSTCVCMACKSLL